MEKDVRFTVDGHRQSTYTIQHPIKLQATLYTNKAGRLNNGESTQSVKVNLTRAEKMIVKG